MTGRSAFGVRWLLAGLAVVLCACAPETGAKASQAEAKAVVDDAHPGKVVYGEWCATCHENPDRGGAPSLAALRQLNRGTIEYALRQGYMKMQAAGIPEAELASLIDYLAVAGSTNDAWIADAACKGPKAKVDLAAKPLITWFGVGEGGQRRLSSAQTGLTTADMGNLELAWAIGFPQTPTMRSQPVVIDSTIFVAATDSGRLFALDTETACVKWMYASELPLRSSLALAKSEKLGKTLIVLGDAAGLVHAVDASDGRLVWKKDIKLDPTQRLTGAPTVYGERVFAPLSTIEINYAVVDTYECCKSRGAVVALDLATGNQLWVGHTMEEPTKREFNRAGAQLWGPSGAPVWSTPLVDPKRNVVYAGTGTNFSFPETDTSDALIAFDMDTGAIRWKYQAAKNDIWNGACSRKGANCDFGGKSIIKDLDWGATPLIGRTPSGKEYLFAGHKSGSVWAFDLANEWKVAWRADFGPGSPSGGIHWGMAFDGERVFAPLNDPTGPRGEGLHGPGLQALDAETGKIVWSFDAKPDCSGDRKTRAPNCATRPGLSAAPLLVDGALVTGSTDGVLRIFEAATGKMLFSYDVLRDYPTTNGVAGHGGGIDNAPFAAANGMLFVNSGYDRFGHPPGNVLLAFRPKKN
jgi:polyvinyl alcohol dehydrogenase (cytochrome)